jgi:secreted PhoX family phosphatase
MYEIQITFKDKNNNTITYNQYKFKGKYPEKNGLEKAKDILNNYFREAQYVGIEVFKNGEQINYEEYKKEMLLNEKFYFVIKNIISRQIGNEEHSDTGIVTAIKKELNKFRCKYE